MSFLWDNCDLEICHTHFYRFCKKYFIRFIKVTKGRNFEVRANKFDVVLELTGSYYGHKIKHKLL
jgi:hypothetical protein